MPTPKILGPGLSRNVPATKKGPPMLDDHDVLHMRGALVAVNLILAKMPDSRRLNKVAARVCDRACDARNALRILLEEHEDGNLTLAALKA